MSARIPPVTPTAAPEIVEVVAHVAARVFTTGAVKLKTGETVLRSRLRVRVDLLYREPGMRPSRPMMKIAGHAFPFSASSTP